MCIPAEDRNRTVAVIPTVHGNGNELPAELQYAVRDATQLPPRLPLTQPALRLASLVQIALNLWAARTSLQPVRDELARLIEALEATDRKG